MAERDLPQPGQIVRIRKGRDAGRFAVVIGQLDDRYVWIADGDKRKFDSPKKKNVIHLEPMPYFASEVVEDLEEGRRVSNRKLRFAIEKFTSYYESSDE